VIPLAGPWITQREIDYVTDAVTNAWYGNASMYHTRFESAFAAYVGRQYAMALHRQHRRSISVFWHSGWAQGTK
jgi:dTDP-4-amino-4,6-dideoxygalactose transaminase